MPQLSKRVERFTDSVIRRMTRISDETPGSINLSQGFPDFDPPQILLDAMKKMSAGGEQHQYPITFGSPRLRKCIADKYSPILGRTIDPEEEVVITCGGTEAMLATVMSICNPGDKIIAFSPVYENYGTDTILCGAEPIYVPLVPPTYDFDRAALEDAFRQGVKAIIVCNPSNPCGKVFTREELLYIEELAEKYDAYVITDEVYEHIVFPPHEHIMAASLPGAYERTITYNSLSKTFSITGWRLGFAIAEPKVAEYIKKVHDFITIGAPAPLQEAVCEAFTLGQEYYDEMLAMYSRKRDIFCGGLSEIGLPHTVPQGSYFVMVDISAFLAREQFAGWTDLQFCEWMVKEVGVAAVPGSSFFVEDVNHLIRLHFARSEESLREALRRLAQLKKYL